MAATITDWDDAYSNGAHIQNADQYAVRWVQQAAHFRSSMLCAGRAAIDRAYGDQPRELYDCFLPVAAPTGVLIFIHGGYWMDTDKSFWSHLATGALNNGWIVIIPSYSLCPESTIPNITEQIGRLISLVASEYDLPIRLAGHSAGGHLVSRMLCTNAPLPVPTQRRIEMVMSISGLHDLRPLLNTTMNDTLQLTVASATVESPALLQPAHGIRICCWAGALERPEFLRQNELLADNWRKLGGEAVVHIEAQRHHFDVIDDLADCQSDMIRTLLNTAADSGVNA